MANCYWRSKFARLNVNLANKNRESDFSRGKKLNHLLGEKIFSSMAIIPKLYPLRFTNKNAISIDYHQIKKSSIQLIEKLSEFIRFQSHTIQTIENYGHCKYAFEKHIYVVRAWEAFKRCFWNGIYQSVAPAKFIGYV